MDDVAGVIRKEFLRRRGWVFKAPRQGAVILLLTGGLDSSVLADMLARDWQAEIYPLYIKRSARAERHELSAAQAAISHLQAIHGTKIHPLMIISSSISPRELKNVDPASIVQYGHPMRNLLLAAHGIQYGMYVRRTINPHIHSICIGSTSDDTYADSQLDAILTNMYAYCKNSDDWTWQVLPPYLEPGLMSYDVRSKKQIIAWANNNKFPIEITRSCSAATKTECNHCRDCVMRQQAIGNK